MKKNFIKNILILSLFVFIGFSFVFVKSIFAQPTPPISAAIESAVPYDTSIVIHGQVFGVNVESPVILFGTDNKNLSNTLPLSPNQTGYFITEITDLAPSTRYYFQVAYSAKATAITDLNSVKTLVPSMQLSVKDVAQTQATFTGKYPDSVNDISIYIDGDGSGNFSASFDPVPSIQKDRTFEFHDSQLTPDTVYRFFAGKKDDKTIRYTGVRSFITLNADGSKPSASLSGSSNYFLPLPGYYLGQIIPSSQQIASTSAVIGNVIPYDTSITVQGQLFGVGISSPVILYGGDKTSPMSIPLSPSPSGFFETEITGLDPATQYYFKVQDSASGVDLTDIRSIKTTIPLLGLSATDVTQTTATIIGKVSSLSSNLTVQVWPNGGNVISFLAEVKTDKTFSFNLTNLTPNTTYKFFSADAKDINNRYTGVRRFETLRVNAFPYVATLGDTKVTIATKLTDGAVGSVVAYGKTDDAMSGNAPLTKNPDGLYTADITGLIPDTGYSYEIAGQATSRLVAYSGVYHFLTSKTPDSTPTPNVKIITDTKSGSSGTPLFSGGIVPCEGGTLPDGKQGCNFSHVIKLIANIINFLLFIVAPAIATCVILYAGILLLTSGGSSENLTKAKGLFFKAVIGLILAMAAWIIVKFIMTQLGYNDTLFPYFY